MRKSRMPRHQLAFYNSIMLRFRVLFPTMAFVFIVALTAVGCSDAADTKEPGYATNEDYGYVATVWANIVDDVDDVPYGGGWELVLNVDPEFAPQTTGVRVIWPDGITTTKLDPDFREGLHPLGSIFSSTDNSRFVKYGTGQGWPQKGPYLFQVTRTDGAVIELTVDYLHELLGKPENVEAVWTDGGTLQVSFTPPPDATHWGVSLNDAYGSRLPSNPTDQRVEDGRVVVVFRGIDNDLGAGAHVSIAMTNDQNIRGADFALPERP